MTTIPPTRRIPNDQTADHMTIGRMLAEYSRCADAGDTHSQLALFAPDAHFAVYYGYQNRDTPVAEFHCREDLLQVFTMSESFQRTLHINSGSVIHVDDDRAEASSACLAHALSDRSEGRTIRTTYNRYVDSFARFGQEWLFTERRIYVEWAEERSAGPDARLA